MPNLQQHHILALQAAAEQHDSANASGYTAKAWMHPRLLKGSFVADQCVQMGLLERSRKPVVSKREGTERIFSYRITPDGLTALANHKTKAMSASELLDALAAANQRNADLQASLMEADRELTAAHRQTVELAEQLLDLQDKQGITTVTDMIAPTPAATPETIAASLSKRHREMLMQIFGKETIDPRNPVTSLTLQGLELITVAGYNAWVIELTDLGEQVASEINRLDIIGEDEAPAAESPAVQIDLQPTAPAPAPTPPTEFNPLEHMDADGLRAIIGQLRQQMSAKDADITDLRGKLAESDKIAKTALGDKVRADRDLQREKETHNANYEKVKREMDRVDQLEKENSLHEAAARNRQADLATYKQRAEAAEQRVAELTAPKPDGHIIARNISEAELDALTEQGRKVSHFQFMPDGTLNAVVEPLRTQPERRAPRNESAYTISGLPIPRPVRVPTPHTPHVPAHNQHHVPRPVGFTPPTAAAPVAPAPVTAVMVVPPTVTPARVPTFPEILSARMSGRITAEQFTRYANALAGHNAAQRVMETRS